MKNLMRQLYVFFNQLNAQRALKTPLVRKGLANDT